MIATQVQAPAIHVQGLEKSYQKLEVLRGVDFDVARGSIFALLGSNGAGKTTIIKILSTLLKADSGTANVNGFDVATQAAEVRESISLTGQFAAVDEILTGRENLVLVARLRHLKEPGTIAREPTQSFLARRRGRAEGVDIFRWHAPPPRHRDEPHRNPPVIFLDEPTAGLDPQGRIEVWQAVGSLPHGADGAAHHAVSGRGRTTRRPDRDPPTGGGRIIVDGTLRPSSSSC